jgi:hypothetical protein
MNTGKQQMLWAIGPQWMRWPGVGTDYHRPAPGRLCAAASLAVVLLLALSQPHQAHANACRDVAEPVSVSGAGEPANATCWSPSINADGRFVAFTSAATNLVPGETNGFRDIFVRDTLLAITERVSVAFDGAQSNDDPGGSAISADGRFVVFSSVATNLVAGDTNDMADVFVRDRLLHTTERVSIPSDGAQANGASSNAYISADGRFVSFDSSATNLVAGDTNDVTDVFVRDRVTGLTERVSISSAGQQANAECGGGGMSADGSRITFNSRADNLVPGDTNAVPGDYFTGWDVFLRDRATGETIRVSVASDGSQADGSSFAPAISADGENVAFYSLASNLLPGFWQGGLFLHHLPTGQILSVTTGTVTNWVISGDGRYVAFQAYVWGPPMDGASTAVLAVVHDMTTGQRVDIICGDSWAPSLSLDGRYVAFVQSWSGDHAQVSVLDRAADGVPPETEIAEPCSQVICVNHADISWTGSDDRPGPVAFAWRLDSGQWSAWTTDTSTTLTGLSDGAHVFEVKARDLSGNEDPTPARCEFAVDTSPPVVSITSLANGATVRGTVTITATVMGAASPEAAHARAQESPRPLAALQAGVERVEFYVNGELLCTDTAAPYTCTWDTMQDGRGTARRAPTGGQPRGAAPTNGPAEICVKAFDKCGRSTQQCITVTVRNQTFEDVPPEHPAWLAIESIAASGITSGCLSAQHTGGLPLFCPYANITRAQLAAFICRAADKQPLNRDVPTFADVPKTHWAYGYIERFCDAASWGGSAPGTWCAIFPQRKFCPGASVTREQIAWILCTAAGNSPMPSCSGLFADVPASNPFCRWIERLADATSWPGSAPVTSGCICPSTSLPSASLRAGGASPSGYPPAAKCYCPKSPVTRAQMAVFLVKAFGIPL